jgi:hypothetical protein
MNVYVLGVSTDALHQPGRLVPGAALHWSASAGSFKAVLLGVPEHTVDAQLDLMLDWREAGAYDDLLFAESMMADRLEHLRGSTVRFRGAGAHGRGIGYDGDVILARYDDVLPGDQIWTRDASFLDIVHTRTLDGTAELSGAAAFDAAAGPKHLLLAVIDRSGAPIERRIVLGKGGHVGSEAWLINAPIAALPTRGLSLA